MPLSQHEAHRRLTTHLPNRASTQGTLAFAAVLLLAIMLAVSSALAFRASAQRTLAERWEVHTHTVLQSTAVLRLEAVNTLRGERGFLLTGDEKFLRSYHLGSAQIRRNMADLRDRVRDNPAQMGRLDLVETRIDAHLQTMAAMIGLERGGRHDEAIGRIRSGEGRRTIEGIMQAIDQFEIAERGLLNIRSDAAKRAARQATLFEYVLGFVGVGLVILATLAAIALRRSLLREATVREELRRIACTDELTGLANRREVLASLDQMIAAARRHSRPLAIAILDIDHFKRVNDTWGHPAGDEVIRHVAQAALATMRQQDVVARLGGEEFIILLPDCTASAAVAACERLRTLIANIAVPLSDGPTIRITLSSGVTQFNNTDDRTRLIARADEALYDAKQGGRDRVRLAA